uniref:R13L1/DRL21-like LRR repeat region domain-containing protein n=1 Tax=Leersia perrieri TaxID=77586 RepID=A0A0D9WXL4_9ORYZ
MPGSVVHKSMLANYIRTCNIVTGITAVVSSEIMEEEQRRLPERAFDDLNYSVHDKITRMNDQAIPSCLADPIYLLPTAIRNLLYLDLSNCSDLVQVPSFFGSLHNLCALNLSCCHSLTVLPLSLGRLHNLHILLLSFCHKLQNLPISFGDLSSLRLLDLSGCCSLEMLPDSFVNLGNLEDLILSDLFNIGDDLSHCSIGDLKNLRGLRGHVHIRGLQNIAAGDDTKEANLVGKQLLEALTVEWCSSSDDMEADNDKEIANQVLRNLQPNTSLLELAIRNYPGNLFPTWIQDSSLGMLVSITIEDCQDCSEIPYLGDLPSLKFLFIQKLYAVESFGQTSNSLATEGKHVPGFPSLEILNLWEMYSLQFWNGTRYGDFPRLHRLSVSRCPKLSNLPPLISLVHLSFHCGNQLPALSELPSLKSLKIEGFHKLKSVQFWPIMPMFTEIGNQRLQRAVISRCYFFFSSTSENYQVPQISSWRLFVGNLSNVGSA